MTWRAASLYPDGAMPSGKPSGGLLLLLAGVVDQFLIGIPALRVHQKGIITLDVWAIAKVLGIVIGALLGARAVRWYEERKGR
jgi:hypothetical protein